MVWLCCDLFWEKVLILVFVFFFVKLYLFLWINNLCNWMVGVVGGCMFVKCMVLEEVGGIELICGVLIDDCSFVV